MKHFLRTCALCAVFFGFDVQAQISIDTLAIQDFEVTPATPTWNFTGPVVYRSGFTTANNAPPNSPIGINGSRAWETTTNSSGLTLDFDNILVPQNIYDSVRVSFRLAAMNLTGTGGGPDNLEYVNFAYSLNNGTTYTTRLRIQGAAANNSVWPYDAQGVAKAYYLPATQVMHQPAGTGLRLLDGLGFVELTFPGNVGQVKIRITARSSSGSDTWMIDNLVLTGEKSCSNTVGTLLQTACKSFTLNGTTYDSTGIFTQILPNATGCDSVLTLNLTINKPDVVVTQNGLELEANATGAIYQWLDCNNNFAAITNATNKTFTVGINGSYAVAVTQNGCTDTSSCTTVSNVGLVEAGTADFRMFPNPVIAEMTLVVPQIWVGRNFILVDLKGKVVLHGKVSERENTLDLSHLAQGVYLFRIEALPNSTLRVVKL